MISESMTKALRLVAERLKDRDIRWVFVGSLSLALQGVSVSPHDIDILTDKAGALKINDLLKDYETRSVEFKEVDLVRSYLGEFRINGIMIEVMAEYQEKVEGKWQSLESRLDSPAIVRYESLQLPVSSLLSQLRSYETSGRDKDKVKVSAIRALLKNIDEKTQNR